MVESSQLKAAAADAEDVDDNLARRSEKVNDMVADDPTALAGRL